MSLHESLWRNPFHRQPHPGTSRHPKRAMSAVAALAGRRIDPPDAKIERFPMRNIDRVQRSLYLEFEKYNVSCLVCSAAAGADLLGIKAAINLGITCRIVLSPSVREFARMSVDDRGSYWKQEFQSTLSAVSPENVVLVPAQSAMGDTFRAINERILNDTIALSVSNSSEPMCLAVWDGVKREKDDFSAHFVECAVARGLPVVTVSTL